MYSRDFWTSGSSSESVLADFRYSATSDCTSVVPSRAISSSYWTSTVASLSNMDMCRAPMGDEPYESNGV